MFLVLGAVCGLGSGGHCGVCGERCFGNEVAVFLQSVGPRAYCRDFGCFLSLIAQRLSRRAPW